jgi:hypothetical protein
MNEMVDLDQKFIEVPKQTRTPLVRYTLRALRRWDGSHRAPPRLDQRFCWSHLRRTLLQTTLWSRATRVGLDDSW